MTAPLKIAFLTTDNRQPFREYDNPQPWFGTAPEALLRGFVELPEVEIHVVSCTQEPMCFSPEKLANNIWFHSLHVPKLGWMRTGYQGCIRASRRKIQEIAPDLVHGQGTERDCSLSAIFSGFPNVMTIHGNMRLVAQTQNAWPLSFYWLAARLEAFTLPRSGGVICLTHHTEQAVRGLAKRTWVLPNAVDPAFFAVQPNRDDIPLLLCVGSICPWKNQNALIRALDSVAASGRLRLVFLGHAGDDAYGQEFRALLSSRPWCEHAGFADREALKGWLSRATLLVLPSLEENCPMVVLEAMAASLPVAAANVGGVPDLVRDGVTGLLFDPRDSESMGQAVGRLLRERDLAAALAKTSLQTANECYHPRRIAQRHLDIYREFLSNNSAQREKELSPMIAKR